VAGITLSLTGDSRVRLLELHDGTLRLDGGSLDQPVSVIGEQNYIGGFSGVDRCYRPFPIRFSRLNSRLPVGFPSQILLDENIFICYKCDLLAPLPGAIRSLVGARLQGPSYKK